VIAVTADVHCLLQRRDFRDRRPGRDRVRQAKATADVVPRVAKGEEEGDATQASPACSECYAAATARFCEAR
jgi:hypothetical protein